VPQRVAVIQVFVAQREAVHALPHERRHRMRDARRRPMIREARRELGQEPRRPIDLPQQHGAAVGGQRAAIKPRHHLAACDPLKRQRFGRTRCRQSGRLRVARKVFLTNP